jgi:hypothetical protein
VFYLYIYDATDDIHMLSVADAYGFNFFLLV